MTRDDRPNVRKLRGGADPAGPFRAAMEVSSPAFSTELHARVMRTLETDRAREVDPSSARPRLRPWQFAALVATAAAVAIAVAVALLLASRPQTDAIVKTHRAVLPATTTTADPRSPLALPRLGDALAYVDPVKARLDRAPRELLTRSADRLHRYCMDQLRILPLRPPRERSDSPAGATRAAG
jgi:hypothetical protein